MRFVIISTAQTLLNINDLTHQLSQYANELGISCIFINCNNEGEVIDALQGALGADGVILNAEAYAGCSIAIRDAIASIKNTPVIELQLTNHHMNGDMENKSLLSAVCAGVIAGFGLNSYFLAIDALVLSNPLLP